METHQAVRLESLRAVQAFIATNADRLATVVESGATRRLNYLIAELAEHVAVQSGGHLIAQGETQRQYALRQALVRDHMAPLVRIARTCVSKLPELEPFRLLRGKPTPQELSDHAHGMARSAEPFAEVLVEAGLHPDFVARLDAAADALIESLVVRRTTIAARVGATRGLELTLREARLIVHALDALITSAIHEDTPLLSSWNAVKRVRRVGRRSEAQLSDTSSVASDPAALPRPDTVRLIGPSSTAAAELEHDHRLLELPVRAAG